MGVKCSRPIYEETGNGEGSEEPWPRVTFGSQQLLQDGVGFGSKDFGKEDGCPNGDALEAIRCEYACDDGKENKRRNRHHEF